MIYYDKKTRTATGEKSESTIESTDERVSAFFKPLEDGYKLEFTVDDLPLIVKITDDEELENERQVKTNEINASCSNEIVGGFISDALGIESSYKSGEIDQLNLIGVVAGGTDDYFKAGTKDADDVITYEYKMHTAAQLLQVLNDGKAYKQILLQKANELKNQIAEATTVEELESIVW